MTDTQVVQPIDGALFRTEQDGSLVLLGSQCGKCGAKFHPQRDYCLKCYSGVMSPVALSPMGKLLTYTTVMQAPPGTALAPPYTLGHVRQEDGPLFLCTSPEVDVFSAGDPIIFEALEVEGPDGPVMGLIFRKANGDKR